VQLSEHFTLEEATFSSTAVRLGIDNTPTQQMIDNAAEAAKGMELVRTLLGFPVHVDSWCRVPLLNSAVNGSKGSDHMNGWAIDFICAAFGVPLDIVKAIIASGIKFDKCVQEGTWIHISFNPLMRGITLTAHFDRLDAEGHPTYTQGI